MLKSCRAVDFITLLHRPPRATEGRRLPLPQSSVDGCRELMWLQLRPNTHEIGATFDSLRQPIRHCRKRTVISARRLLFILLAYVLPQSHDHRAAPRTPALLRDDHRSAPTGFSPFFQNCLASPRDHRHTPVQRPSRCQCKIAPRTIGILKESSIQATLHHPALRYTVHLVWLAKCRTASQTANERHRNGSRS